MYKIKDKIENTIIIKKSKFICQIFRVDSIEEINDILANTRKKYYDATHNCYAYILGENQDIQKASDDGEPQKTAGGPMLDVLKKNNLTNVLAIVTRYFGGTLLGAGGLIRAYSSSVSEALENVKLYVDKLQTKFNLTISYSDYNNVLNIKDINIIETSFLNDVIIIGSIDLDKFDDLENMLYKNKITSVNIKKIGDFKIEIPVSA